MGLVSNRPPPSSSLRQVVPPEHRSAEEVRGPRLARPVVLINIRLIIQAVVCVPS